MYMLDVFSSDSKSRKYCSREKFDSYVLSQKDAGNSVNVQKITFVEIMGGEERELYKITISLEENEKNILLNESFFNGEEFIAKEKIFDLVNILYFNEEIMVLTSSDIIFDFIWRLMPDGESVDVDFSNDVIFENYGVKVEKITTEVIY